MNLLKFLSYICSFRVLDIFYHLFVTGDGHLTGTMLPCLRLLQALFKESRTPFKAILKARKRTFENGNMKLHYDLFCQGNTLLSTTSGVRETTWDTY